MNEFKSYNGQQTFQAENQEINILQNFIEKKKSILAEIIFKLSKIELEEKEGRNYEIPLEYTIEDKIQYNNVKRYEWLITQYGIYGKEIDEKYDELDEEAPGKKQKFFRMIKDRYQENLGKYIANSNEKEKKKIIEENADNIIEKIIEELKKMLMNSENLKEEITIEEFEIGTKIIVAHAFIHCKILENPNKNDNTN